ncbi:hypothetical protein ACFQ9X_52515 [Catenulispora yoronensis]
MIGIVDAYGSPTMRADADQFASSVGDQPFADGQYLETIDTSKWAHVGDGVCETPATWGGEQALDVEMAHGLAPDATVHYFSAASCDDHDIAATLAQIVDQHSADTVTGAFGEIMHFSDGELDPALVDQEERIFITGAVEGIGFSFASGDCGDQAPGLAGPACDPATARVQTEWPASSPGSPRSAARHWRRRRPGSASGRSRWGICARTCPTTAGPGSRSPASSTSAGAAAPTRTSTSRAIRRAWSRTPSPTPWRAAPRPTPRCAPSRTWP